jgi:ABC-type nitrate/sulfonate/bicarbonate transport system permease component
LKAGGSILLMLTILLVWEVLARTGGISATFFPPPSLIALAVARLTAEGSLASHAGITLARVAAGFALGGGSGMVLGMAMGGSPRLRAQLDPLVAAAHPVPKIAVLPLFLVIFGIGESSKVVLAALGAFFPMVISTMAGVVQISPIYFEVATSYGASPLKRFTRVVLPASLPHVFTGSRLSLNVALTLTIAGELVAAQRGLGQMLWFAWQTLRIDEVYAGIVVIGALGLVSNLLLDGVAAWAMPWQASRITAPPAAIP